MIMMRKAALWIGLFVVLGWSSGASALPANNPITAGLVAAYEFTGNADDVSGNGNNGTVVGAILTADRHGETNSAYRFNGSDDRIVMDPVFGATQDPFTLAAWVRTESAGGISLYGEFTSWGGTQNYVTASVGPSITLDNYPPSGGGIAFNLDAPDPSIYDNVWIHMTLTVDSGLASGYINGNLIGSGSYTEIYNGSGNGGAPTVAAIGSRNHAGWYSRGHAGDIDDVYIYNRVLSPTEVSTLYSVVPEPSTALLLGIGLSALAATRRCPS